MELIQKNVTVGGYCKFNTNHNWVYKDIIAICNKCGRCKNMVEPTYIRKKKYKKWSTYKIIY